MIYLTLCHFFAVSRSLGAAVSVGGVLKESEKMLEVSSIAWENSNDYPSWCKQHENGPVNNAGSNSRNLNFNSGDANMNNNHSARCPKD